MGKHPRAHKPANPPPPAQSSKLQTSQGANSSGQPRRCAPRLASSPSTPNFMALKTYNKLVPQRRLSRGAPSISSARRGAQDGSAGGLTGPARPHAAARRPRRPRAPVAPVAPLAAARAPRWPPARLCTAPAPHAPRARGIPPPAATPASAGARFCRAETRAHSSRPRGSRAAGCPPACPGVAGSLIPHHGQLREGWRRADAQGTL